MKFGIKRWEPFEDMATLREDIDSLFNDFVKRVPIEQFAQENLWFPALNIEETKNSIEISAELPGLKKDEIKLTISNGQLVLQGERKLEKEEKDKTYHRIERRYGSFRRTVSLPTEAETDKVKAIYEKGILNITLPKSKKAKPKEIGITVK